MPKEEAAPDMPVDQMEAILAGVQSKSEGSEKGVKPAVKVVSPTTDPEVLENQSDPPSTAEEAEAKIKGLQAELSRRKGNAERVEQLESELAFMKGQLDTLVKTNVESNDPIAAALAKMDDDTLVTRGTDWVEELSSLRSKFDRAEEINDTTVMQELGSRIAQARKIIKAIQTEDRSRADRKRTAQAESNTANEVVTKELSSMYDAVAENHPEFDDKESDLWKAGNEEFSAYPEVMKRLGPAAEIVAAALAVIKHPELVGAKENTEVRRETLKNIDKGFSRALSVGNKGNPGTQPKVEYTVETGDGLAAFNRLVDKVKGG